MNIGSFHSNGILNKNSQEFFSTIGESFTTLKEANTFCQNNLLHKGERWDEQKETPVLKKCKENELNSKKIDIFILMDELARAIYEEYKK